MELFTRAYAWLAAFVAVFVASGGDGWPWN